MTPEELAAALGGEAAALSQAARGNLELEVPSCPGWTVETLLNHLGRVHRWALAAVRGGGAAPDGFPPRPPEVTEAWFEEGVAALRTALEETSPDAPAWTLLGKGTVRFWARRQALETAVHRWDVQRAVSTPDPIDIELGIVGVDEIVDVHLPRRLAGSDPPPLPEETLHLHATDSPHGEWTLRALDGELLVGHGHGKADGAVRGSASDLLLWLWGRLPLDDLEVVGSRPAAVAWAGLLAA